MIKSKKREMEEELEDEEEIEEEEELEEEEVEDKEEEKKSLDKNENFDDSKTIDYLSEIRNLLMKHEEVIAKVTTGGLLNKGWVAATDRRIIVKWPQLFGLVGDIISIPYKEVENIEYYSGLLHSKIIVRLNKEKIIKGTTWEEFSFIQLPKHEAKKLYSYIKEQQYDWEDKHHEKHIRELEAASGGVRIQQQIGANSSEKDNLKSKLTELKELFDEKLITKEEYLKKKRKILEEL